MTIFSLVEGGAVAVRFCMGLLVMNVAPDLPFFWDFTVAELFSRTITGGLMKSIFKTVLKTTSSEAIPARKGQVSASMEPRQTVRTAIRSA